MAYVFFVAVLVLMGMAIFKLSLRIVVGIFLVLIAAAAVVFVSAVVAWATPQSSPVREVYPIEDRSETDALINKLLADHR